MAENNQELKNDRAVEVHSLLDLSAGIVANNAENLFHQIWISEKQQQQSCDQGFLPVRASEKVLQKLCDKWRGRSTSPEVAAALAPFYNGQPLPVANANFSNVPIADRMLAAFLVGQQKTLTSLSLINNTRAISAAILCTLLQNSNLKLMNLRSLKLNSLDILRVPKVCRREQASLKRVLNAILPQFTDEGEPTAKRTRSSVLPQFVINNKSLNNRIPEENDEPRQIGSPLQFVHFCPNLEHLYLLQDRAYNNEEVQDESKNAFLVRIFSELPKLKTLDLSGWVLLNFSPLQKLQQSLTTLVLYNVRHLKYFIITIASLKTLRHLDISQSKRSHGQYPQPVSSLYQLASSLKRLQCLDISGTNLTDIPSENDHPFKESTSTIESDIPGLRYLERPLKYLGIFNCEGTSADWKNIPAEKISSEYGEDQLLTAMQMYLERPRTLWDVLKRSSELYEDGNDLHRHGEALHLVLCAMELHLGNERVQICGAASISHLIRNLDMNQNTKRRVIQALIDGMEKHLDSPAMVHNCCLGLYEFEFDDIPQCVMFAYGRVANLLTRVLEKHNLDAHIQQILVSLLYAMVCHVEVKQRIEMGETGAIEIMLQQISRKLQMNTYDFVMEDGWYFLWVVTIETPENCERFLEAGGLALFIQCYTKFADEKPEFVPCLMGVIRNIGEVCKLREQLMTNECLQIFCKLLANLDEGILVSYISAGVLANLISDERWDNKPGVDLSVDHVSMLIVQTTEKWDLRQARMDSFVKCIKTLKPFLRLLSQWNATGAQHWAVWSLANLTADNDEKQKYCRLITEEGGIELLEQFKTDPRSTDAIRQLADNLLKNVEDWKNNSPGSSRGLLVD